MKELICKIFWHFFKEIGYHWKDCKKYECRLCGRWEIRSKEYKADIEIYNIRFNK